MGPSLILHHIRPFRVWCYAHIAAQVRKRKHDKSHTQWGSKVRFMGFEDYCMRLFCPNADEIFVDSATFHSGPDLMELQIPREAVERICVINRQVLNSSEADIQSSKRPRLEPQATMPIMLSVRVFQ